MIISPQITLTLLIGGGSVADLKVSFLLHNSKSDAWIRNMTAKFEM